MQAFGLGTKLVERPPKLLSDSVKALSRLLFEVRVVGSLSGSVTHGCAVWSHKLS